MARVNVYLPDDLAAEAKAASLNVSNLTQQALQRALGVRRVDEWLEGIGAMRPLGVDHDAVALAVADAKDEFDIDG